MLQAFFSMPVLIPTRNRTGEPLAIMHEEHLNDVLCWPPPASPACTHDLIGLIWESTALRMATTGSR
jgi:hypothetical protein